ncbi:hypothetical protein D3C76_242680 [compost metagenome]
MLGDKKEITAGDNSTNVQGQIVNISTGISFADARDIALQTFIDNFYQLSEVAKNTALERAELLVNRFLDKLQKESPDLIGKIVEPDIQYAVINAQKQYARSGRIESLELLSQLLKERFQVSEEDSLKRIVVNESIEALTKLTTEHLKFLAIIFLVKNAKVHNVDNLFHLLSLSMSDKWNLFKDDLPYMNHLVAVGVATNDTIINHLQNFETIMRNTYEGVLLKDMNPLNDTDEIRGFKQKYITNADREKILENWNNSILRGFTLTAVGISLAVTYLVSVMDMQLDIGIWIEN